jgi:hypothetical protein
MEDEQLLNREDESRIRWIFRIGGLFYSLAAAHSIWSHGLRSWDWVQNAWFALLFFSFFSLLRVNGQERPGERSWRSRVFWLAYGSLFGAWIGHEHGWVPGGCIILFFALPATARKSGWWSVGTKKPLGILGLAIVAVGIGWLLWNVSEWPPFVCLIVLALLLSYEKEGRRSIRENLLRPASAGWIATAGVAFFWLRKEPSFAGVVLLLAILVLWFGNFLMHISSGERVALPHPQS